MKIHTYFALLFCSLFLPTILQAQYVQKGVVREQNSGKKILANVQVIYDDAVPTFAGQDGQFKLVFKDKAPGAFVFLAEINKSGYEVVNKREVEQFKLNNTSFIGTDIIMAKTGSIDAAKKEYYQISDAALEAGFRREKEILRNQLKAAKLNEEDYMAKLNTSRKAYEKQRSKLDQLADKFARVNFDDVDKMYKMALDTFKLGKIDKAISILEGANLLNRADKRIKERNRITAAEQEISDQKAENEKGIKSDVEMLLLLTDMYIAQLEINKAEPLFDQLILLDSTNLTVLTAASMFYYNYQRFPKAMGVLKMMLSNKKINEIETVKALRLAGSILMKQNNLDSAKVFYNQGYELCKKINEEYPENTAFQFDLAMTHSCFGYFNFITGDYLKGREEHLKGLHIYKTIYDAAPENYDYARKLAYSYNCVGVSYALKGKQSKAKKYYLDASQLLTKIDSLEPDKIQTKKQLIGVNSKLINLYIELKMYNKVFLLCETNIQIANQLIIKSPDDLRHKRSLELSYANLANALYEQGDSLEQSEKLILKAIELGKEILNEHPISPRYQFDMGELHWHMAKLEKKRNNIEKAETELTKAKEIICGLSERFPNVVFYVKFCNELNEEIQLIEN